ncbi:TauD/TfdA family dioxygenase [Salegentibacter sp. UBA1130]|uniref:TauD/TfdA family dioxygenase n=1 Tax=Salegentibacter sp. UBA1130 TaxID=1947451 RepID=UPI00257F6E20|nr:TauD/TfdA family dioxygenase [Salegentibacter sp. UBA1130]
MDSLFEDEYDLPYVWKSKGSEIQEIFKDDIKSVETLLDKNGAILFKGFNVDNASKLSNVVDSFPGDTMNYISGNSPRTNIKEAVFSSTEYPPHAHISLHNEMSYANKWPKFLFFCCEVAPSKGGHTILADSRKILSSLSKDLITAFRERGVKYVRNLNNGNGFGLSWKQTFNTDNKKIVEQYCNDSGIKFKWSSDGSLQLVEDRPATIIHPQTGEEVWFNQVDQFHPSTHGSEIYHNLQQLFNNPEEMPQYAFFGDGQEISLAMLNEIREVSAENTRYFNWENGDLLLVDNILVSHGRDSFQGPRKVLVSMIK